MDFREKVLQIRFGRKISKETYINSHAGVIIAAPDENTGFEAAERIKEFFISAGCNAEVIKNPDHTILFNKKSPVIVMGNLSNSRCVEYLYYKFLCVTDKWYPGNGGYNIRTILNPFGTGFNVIHMGYSDDEGLKNALKVFLERAANPLPFYNEVSYTKLPYGDKYIERIRKSPIPEESHLICSIHTSYWWLMGYIAYLTGDSEQLFKYLDAWKKLIEISEKTSTLGNNTHLYMLSHVECWRLLEHAGMIPDDLRGKIEECIFNWANSSEGKGYASHGAGRMLPSHNHTMFCALSLIYAADFFKTHYAGVPEPHEWKSVADNVFYTFNNGGWKPYCDDSAYSNQVTLPLVCMYSIYDDDHRFLKKGGKEAAKWIKAIMGQNGFVPSFGDGTVNNPFPASLLRVLSHYYKDGELKYMHDNVPDDRNVLPDIELHRMFDSGVEKVKPEINSLVTVIPMDEYIYNSWNVDKDEGRKLTGTAPEGPRENCFDKISIRTGWEEDHEFLLIDGLGSNGVHAYSDAMGILDYTAKGITWLVEENCYRWPEPENCSILTVTRNGYASDIPGFALLEEKKVLDDDIVYLRMRSKNYNGTDWVREVFFVKGLCTVFNDAVYANEEGQYVASAHFKTPGSAGLNGNTLKCVRENQSGEKYELRLSGYGTGKISQATDEIPVGETLFSCGGMDNTEDRYDHGIKMAELGREMWVKRYNESRIVLTRLTTSMYSELNKGEGMSLTHIVHPAMINEEDIRLVFRDDKMCLEHSGKSIELPLYCHGIRRKEVDFGIGSGHKEFSVAKENGLNETSAIKIIDSDRHALALQDGSFAFVSGGEVQWKRQLHGKIHAVEYAGENGGMLLVGSGNDKLSAFDMKGNLLWETHTKRIPTVFPSWEKKYPQILKIKYGCIDNKPIIAAGCGDNQVRIYDMAGQLQNAFYIYATVPDIIEFIDIDGDGKTEILAAGREASSQGAFYVHDIDGNPKEHIYVGKWLCIIKAYDILYLDNKIIIACGMNYDENFKILEIENGKISTVSAKSLGGMVSSICADSDNAVFHVTTSKGYVMTFDIHGNLLGLSRGRFFRQQSCQKNRPYDNRGR